MGNSIKIHFSKENNDILLDVDQPDLTKLVKTIISCHLDVTKENIVIEETGDDFDIDEFINIIVSVHEEFSEEITKFYTNIASEINTYYDDEPLGAYIISELQKEEQLTVESNS